MNPPGRLAARGKRWRAKREDCAKDEQEHGADHARRVHHLRIAHEEPAHAPRGEERPSRLGYRAAQGDEEATAAATGQRPFKNDGGDGPRDGDGAEDPEGERDEEREHVGRLSRERRGKRTGYAEIVARGNAGTSCARVSTDADQNRAAPVFLLRV